ncbi:MAG: hypothetical protein JSV44_04240, partial [Candidatus Zixiibacteriota bacterium]
DLLDILKYIDCLYLEGDAFSCGLPHDDNQSECLGAASREGDTMFVLTEGLDIHIYHLNAFYDCCLGYYTTNSIDLNNIVVYEHDSIPECDCMCNFNLETVLSVEFGGTYVVTLIGLDGFTVGVDTAYVDILPLSHEEEQSSCLSNTKSLDDDTVFFEVLGNDLHTHHLNAFYNCGLDYVVYYDVSDFIITAVEADTGMPADCMCYFNLESVLYNLENGEYTVTLFNIYGEPIGHDTIIVDDEYGLEIYEQSDCLENPTGTIMYSYANEILTFEHHDAFYNCGAEILVQFEQADDTLRFYELNISYDAAHCMCYFELNATAVGIPPGNYVAEVYARDFPTADTYLVDRRTLILE